MTRHVRKLLVLIVAFPLPSLAVAQEADMDRAVGLLTEARQRFEDVHDYETRLIKRERINGKLLPETEFTIKVRSHPFSVYVRCERPGPDKGLEACYVTGQNRGKMRVHPTGALGVLGFLSIAPDDPRALEKNRHCITQAGLGRLMENTNRYWQLERRLNRTQVEIADDNLDGRPCTRITTIHPDRGTGQFYGYRCVLWLEKATKLPIGAETYDWPRPDGPPEGDLIESYRYLNIQVNIGLPDSVFAH